MTHGPIADWTTRKPLEPHEMLMLSAEDQRRWLQYYARTDPDYAQLLHHNASPTDIILYLLALKTEMLRRYQDRLLLEVWTGLKGADPHSVAQQYQQRPADPDDVPLGECSICGLPQPCNHTRKP